MIHTIDVSSAVNPCCARCGRAIGNESFTEFATGRIYHPACWHMRTIKSLTEEDVRRIVREELAKEQP